MKYNLPVFGEVTIEIGELASKFLEIMEKHGEIDRLNKLLHLGVLQDNYPGTRHTRWDYTMANLFIIEKIRLCKAFKGIGGCRKIKKVKVYGRDVLELLSLLNNIGHLPGTFATEKAILKYCVKYKDAYQRIINAAGLKDKKGNKKIEDKIDYINFNKILALIKLNRWLEIEKEEENKRIIKICIELMKEHLQLGKGTEWFKKIYDYYNFSRRIAYQLYDSLYLAIPLKINYLQFIKDLPELLDNIDSWKIIREILDSYTRLIYRYIYNSESSRKRFFVYAQYILQKLEKGEDILEFISQLLERYDLEEIKNKSSEWEKIASFEVPKDFYAKDIIEKFRKEGIEKIENEYEMKVKDAKICMFYIPGIKDPFVEYAGGEFNIDIWIKEKTYTFEEIILKTIKFFSEKLKKIKGREVIMRRLIEKFFEQVSKEIDRVEIQLYPSETFRDSKDNVLCVHESLEKEKIIQKFSKSTKSLERKIGSKFFKEFKVFKEIMKSVWRKEKGRYYILIPGNIKFRNDSKDICEHDGGIITFLTERKNKIISITIYLLEASAKKKRKNAAAELEKKLKNKLKINKKRYEIKSLSPRSAFAIINMK